MTLPMQFPAQLREEDSSLYKEVLNNISTFVRGNIPIDCSLSIVHTWGKKRYIQPTDRFCPDHNAPDGSKTRMVNEHSLLSAGVEPATDHLLHGRLFPARVQTITEWYFTELRPKQRVDDTLFSSMAHRDSSRRYIGTAHDATPRNISSESVESWS